MPTSDINVLSYCEPNHWATDLSIHNSWSGLWLCSNDKTEYLVSGPMAEMVQER